ncbi:hypothetical protein E5F92_009220 [Flavobacterium columnare]|uniref:hypothetical protein n=1 Tax=Flavobacterium columnare TaxID=996 RepID=UPI00298A06A3|nr:hypothetical protein [Flavobacterium columnare]MCH4832844.1 hypothetical protein [Flavobacterium columnare]
MIQITAEFKEKVVTELIPFVKLRFIRCSICKQWNINNAVWSQLKNGKRDGLLKDNQWLTMGRELNIDLYERVWNIAKTEVYNAIEEDIVFCQNNSKSRIFVDDCSIGKTTTQNICQEF